jgi:hypothetical protein
MIDDRPLIRSFHINLQCKYYLVYPTSIQVCKFF